MHDYLNHYGTFIVPNGDGFEVCRAHNVDTGDVEVIAGPFGTMEEAEIASIRPQSLPERAL